MITSLEYVSLAEAQTFIPSRPTVAISILSPGRTAASLHPTIGEIHRLYFEDGVPRTGNPDGTVLFDRPQAEAVIAFLRAQHARADDLHLLVHCEAGMSRSAAVAVFAASECGLPISGKIAFLNPHVLTTLVKVAYPHYAFD